MKTLPALLARYSNDDVNQCGRSGSVLQVLAEQDLHAERREYFT